MGFDKLELINMVVIGALILQACKQPVVSVSGAGMMF